MLRDFSLTTSVVFDIDGVIIDSREMVREAYSACGVVMPDDAWGKPWQEWLPKQISNKGLARAVHKEKTERYLQMIASERPMTLPGYELARFLMNRGLADVFFLTGADHRAAALILETLRFSKMQLLRANATRVQKIAALRKHLHENTHCGRVIYIDDDPAAAYDIGKKTALETIHYHGQTVEEMVNDIWTP